MNTETKRPYCRPLNAGLCSATSAVCRRIGRLLTAIDTEISRSTVDGQINDDIREFRFSMMQRLENEGWSMSYDGGNTMKVRQPGHKKPFNRTTRED